MTIYQWLCVFAVPNLIACVWSIIPNRKMKERDKKQEELKKQNEQLEAEHKATQLGVQALLRDRLLQAFKHYLKLGSVDYNERANVENMYKQYEILGPNNVMNDLYEQFKALPMIAKE